MEPKIDTATIVRNSFALLRANVMPAFGVLLALAGLATAIDSIGPDNPGLNFVIAAAAIFAQYFVTRSALRAAGLRSGPGSGGSFVGALILSGLGIALGLVLLILPGLYLWARWSMVAPLVVGEGMSSGEALRTSWARTQPLVGPIAAALVILTVPLVLFAAVPLAFYPEYGPVPLGLALIANLFVYGWQMLIWHCAVTIHGLTQEPSNELEHVFA